MTDSRPSDRASRLASSADRRASGDGGGRALSLGGLLATLLSAGGSVAAHAALPARIRIHWTLGAGPYYGPEFAPSWLVLAAFPALVGGVALGARWLDGRLRRVEGFAPVRPYYVLSVAATLGALLIAQGALVAANL